MFSYFVKLGTMFAIGKIPPTTRSNGKQNKVSKQNCLAIMRMGADLTAFLFGVSLSLVLASRLPFTNYCWVISRHRNWYLPFKTQLQSKGLDYSCTHSAPTSTSVEGRYRHWFPIGGHWNVSLITQAPCGGSTFQHLFSAKLRSRATVG